jgi:hypothetical protein
MRSASSGLASTALPGQIGGSPSMIGPAVTIVGPSRSPREISARHASVCSLPNMLRMVVTPAARNSVRSLSLQVWTCMSARPGISHLFVPSIVLVPAGTSSDATGATAMIRSPRTTTVWCASTPSRDIGTTETLVIATSPGCSAIRGAAGSL